MKEKDILKTQKWLSVDEINDNLKGVEFILMAAPTMDNDASTPVHFTLYLNTHEVLPDEIVSPVFDKFCKDYKITKVRDMINGLLPVAFALNDRDTAMPLLFLDGRENESELEYTHLYVFDFEGNAEGFKECKSESKTGWTYAYSSDD
jgi:hypothetical protein